VQFILEEREFHDKANYNFNEAKIFQEEPVAPADPSTPLLPHEEENSDEAGCQSSVEIHFTVLTTPTYIGLIRDSEFDLLCENNDYILANDDKHEDLVRACNLLDLLTSSKASRLHYERPNFSELYKVFDKKQLIQSIPYYFKIPNDTDYRVYFYNST